jgi:hypothetical protein
MKKCPRISDSNAALTVASAASLYKKDIEELKRRVLEVENQIDPKLSAQEKYPILQSLFDEAESKR